MRVSTYDNVDSFDFLCDLLIKQVAAMSEDNDFVDVLGYQLVDLVLNGADGVQEVDSFHIYCKGIRQDDRFILHRRR